jgi:hypothetical protein
MSVAKVQKSKFNFNAVPRHVVVWAKNHGRSNSMDVTKTSIDQGSHSTLDTEFSEEPLSPMSLEAKKISFDDNLDTLPDDVADCGRRSCMKKPNSLPRSKLPTCQGQDVFYYLPGQHRPARRTCYVAFKKTVQIKRVVPVIELVDNYDHLWYQGAELTEIRSKASRIVYKVKNNMTKGRNYCTRGLEGCLQDDRQTKRFESLQSVLDEQELQFVQGFDDSRIRDVYVLTTERSKIEAAARAICDEEDAIAYYQYSS